MVEATFLRLANKVKICSVKYLENLYKTRKNYDKMKER